MPYEIPNLTTCAMCRQHCVTYVGNREFRDRDTLYRIIQTNALACAFDNFIPGFTDRVSPDALLSIFAQQMIGNARQAGLHLESLVPNHFGAVRSPFALTSGQIGKVSGDAFQMIVQAILWNAAAYLNRAHRGDDISQISHLPPILKSTHLQYPIAILTLGDRYDLKRLLIPEEAALLSQYEQGLHEQGTRLSYSTPDLVCINLESMEPLIRHHFYEPVQNLSGLAQSNLNGAKVMLEGKVRASDVMFAAGLKTSLRSDRLFQFLFEASAWKFIWKQALQQAVSSRYYAVATREFGADVTRLQAVDFTSTENGVDKAKKAIDEARLVTTPRELVQWFVDVLLPDPS